MPVRRFLILMSLAGLASLAAWVVVIKFIDPTQTGSIGIGLFYATLGCWVFAVMVVFGLLIRIVLKRWHKQTVVAFHLMLPTFRQAIFCTCIVLLSLVLTAHELFTWMTAGLLVLFFSLLEGFLYSLQRQPTHEEPVN
ncbi:MAG: hypothetical protein WCV88_04810 [Patescibacteria group bacterium]|jgi:hypothetical protein